MHTQTHAHRDTHMHTHIHTETQTHPEKHRHTEDPTHTETHSQRNEHTDTHTCSHTHLNRIPERLKIREGTGEAGCLGKGSGEAGGSLCSSTTRPPLLPQREDVCALSTPQAASLVLEKLWPEKALPGSLKFVCGQSR